MVSISSASPSIAHCLRSSEFWYSAVCRSMQYGRSAPDPSRQVLAWQRMCAWTLLEPFKSRSTVILFRCPVKLKTKLCHLFQGENGAKLMAHPMLIHSFLLEHVTITSNNFQHRFSDPLYKLVRKPLPYRCMRMLTMTTGIGRPQHTHGVGAHSSRARIPRRLSAT